MGKTLAQLATDMRQPLKDDDLTTAEATIWLNLALPIVYRDLWKFSLWAEHLTYIPRLEITMTSGEWEYNWRETSKYSADDVGASSGVISIDLPQSTYYIAPGDIAYYRDTNYTIIDLSSTCIVLDADIGPEVNGSLYIYANPLFIVNATYRKSGEEYPSTAIRMANILSPNDIRYDDGISPVKFYIRGNTLGISPLPGDGDILSLFYIPKPITLSSTNALITALENPSGLSDEMNQALVYKAGELFWLRRGEAKEAQANAAIYSAIINGANNGMIAW